MAFFKFRARGPQGNEGRNSTVAAAPAESIEAMRRRARHRLVGAAVLVLVGVIGFPLLFDTQPRPISVDIPIEIPDRNKTKPLTLPATPAPTTSSSAGANSAPASGGGGIITEAADGTEIPAGKVPPSSPAAEAKSEPAPEVKSSAKAEVKPDPKPEPKPKPEARAETKPEPKPEPKPAAPKSADDGDRARALLEGKAAAAAAAKPTATADESGRFVVQVGAFADADKAKEVRQKLEKAGLKTYMHVAKTADGERTRVRVGPFASRAEADRAASKVKGLSLPAAVLSL
ncbi:SPOR domain-containing protein [Variovorax sp. GT1P44]|uniref:SPOR domain-containing protein n=1 Tax=Variovorax sp. GT1P44 TaxID=3443742 RepID=UPI003F4544C1